MAYLCCAKYEKYSNKEGKGMGIIPIFMKYLLKFEKNTKNLINIKK